MDLAMGEIAAGLPHFKAGTLRPLGIFNTKRIKALPDYPTVAEQGFPVDTAFIYGLFGPKDIPKGIVEALNSAAGKAYNNQKAWIDDTLANVGAEARYEPPEEYSANLHRQRDFFKKLIEGLPK